METLATQKENTASEKPAAVAARITPVVEEAPSQLILIITSDIDQQEAIEWDDPAQNETQGSVRPTIQRRYSPIRLEEVRTRNDDELVFIPAGYEVDRRREERERQLD